MRQQSLGRERKKKSSLRERYISSVGSNTWIKACFWRLSSTYHWLLESIKYMLYLFCCFLCVSLSCKIIIAMHFLYMNVLWEYYKSRPVHTTDKSQLLMVVLGVYFCILELNWVIMYGVEYLMMHSECWWVRQTNMVVWVIHGAQYLLHVVH